MVQISVEPEPAHTPEKLRAAETQRSGGPGLVTVRAPERLDDHLLLELGQLTNVRPGPDLRGRASRSRDVVRRPRDDAELRGGDQLTIGEDERSLDGVLQLADVAGPRVRQDQIARLSAEAGLELTHVAAQLTHEVIRQQQHI